MKKGFTAAAIAGVTSAFSMKSIISKMLPTSQTYRQRDGNEDPLSTKVIASTADGIFSSVAYTPANAQEDFSWSINCSTIVNEDSGDTILILTHMLTAKILHADKLVFNVKFTSGTDFDQNSVIGLVSANQGYDNARCTMENDTRNTDYWIVNLEDGHYLSATNTVYVKDATTAATNLGQDWFKEKEDVDRSSPLCTKPGSATWTPDKSYFAC